MALLIFPIIAGIVPSIIWLLFYLRKDQHPESNKMILKVFAFGMIITFIAAFTEIGVEEIAKKGLSFWENNIAMASASNSVAGFIAIFLIIAFAFIEEFFKYLVIREKVINNPEFDEPVDAMVYMIIVALGFAAAENMLVFFSLDNFFQDRTIYIIILRFLGATFLHALCSATIGYYLAMALWDREKRLSLMFNGIALATLLHAIYNFSIIKAESQIFFVLIPAILLIHLALFISYAFNKLSNKKGLCAVKLN